MALQISDIKVMLSGGSLNGDPDASLGGEITSLAAGEVISQLASPASSPIVTGVTIINAYANPVGDGTLAWDSGQSRLQWMPLGAVQFSGVDVTTDGTYVVGNSGGYIICDVVVASLPPSSAQDVAIAITNKINNVFDSVSASESQTGLIEYRCMYIKNTHSTDTAYDVRIWVKQQPVGPDDLDISVDPAGVGNGSSTGVAIGPINTETDIDNEVSGLPWSRPTTQAAGLQLGDLTPGDTIAFWERRTVYPETTTQVSNDYSKIGISALI